MDERRMITIFVGIGLVIVTVLIHHEVLYLLSRQLQRSIVYPRFRLIFGVIGAILAHVIEITLFAVGYHLLIRAETYGTFIGEELEGFCDILYFSFVTYSSLGYGDIRPEGHIRFVSAMEVLVGLVMIAWTASFLYYLIKSTWANQKTV